MCRFALFFFVWIRMECEFQIMYIPREDDYYSYSSDIWCFENYYKSSTAIFYTFFNPQAESHKCNVTYSYNYIGCFLEQSKKAQATVDQFSARTINFNFKSTDEANDEIQKTYVLHHVTP